MTASTEILGYVALAFIFFGFSVIGAYALSGKFRNYIIRRKKGKGNYEW